VKGSPIVECLKSQKPMGEKKGFGEKGATMSKLETNRGAGTTHSDLPVGGGNHEKRKRGTKGEGKKKRNPAEKKPSTYLLIPEEHGERTRTEH